MTPTERYQADVASGKVMRDPEQIRVIGHLTDLCRGLEEKAKPVNGTCLQRLIYAVREKVNAPVSLQGMYLWGGVGRGKTYLMDLFFALIE